MNTPIPNPQTRKSHHQCSGFALVIALGLMAFVLLLILSISTFVQVESANSVTTKDQLTAKMNAQLGGIIALGELQKLAGPDQRISARPDILLAPGTEPVEGQAQWTGIWSSKQDTADALDTSLGLDSHGVRWLVSGEAPDATLAVDPDTSVALATVGKSVERSEQTVRAALEEIEDGGNDAFAYWVSDEGGKARLNLDDPFRGTTLDFEKYYRAAIAQQGDASAVKDASANMPYAPDGTVSIWKEADSNVSRVASAGSLPLLQPTAADPAMLSREFFHDFSATSRTVFANTKDGGLKRDLSTALINLPADLSGPIFPPANATPATADPGGPKWEQLADYYNYALAGNTGAVDFRMPTKDQVGITPVVTRLNYVIQVFAEKYQTLDPTKELANDYRYSVGMFPLITLWNPYDHDLVVPDLGLQMAMKGVYLVDTPDGHSDGAVNSDGLRQSSNNILNVIEKWGVIPNDITQNLIMIGFTIEGTTIPAGRAINFSPPNNSYISFTDPEQNVLKAGASAGLVRGFFSPPVAMDATAAPVDLMDSSNQIQVCMAGMFPFVWDQIINLYSRPGKTPGDRFLTLTVPGPGNYFYNHPWFSPRIIRISDIGEPDFSFIQASNSSASAPYSDSTPVDLGDIARLAHTIAGMSAVMAFPENDSNWNNKKSHIFSQMNPRSPLVIDQMHVRTMYNQDPLKFGYRLYDPGRYEWFDQSDISPNYIDGADDVYSFVGLSNSAIGGSDRMVLFELPTQAPLGIGQFMHANLLNVDHISHTTDNGAHWRNNLQQPHTYPAYAIGNSFANIHLPLDSTRLTIDNSSGIFSSSVTLTGGGEGAHYDYSYELNEKLWDGFFLSTLLPDNTALEFPLPNARIHKWKSDTTNAELLLEDEAAAHLLLDGGFNINSTSVAAWESVLGALRNVDTLGQSADDPLTQVHNFARLQAPLVESTSEVPDPYSEGDAISAGFRSLTDDQISDLAASIVAEIRTRRSSYGYPARSLNEFINRSIEPADIASASRKRFAYMGPLQFAIDQSSVNGAPALDADWNDQSGTGLSQSDYITDALPAASDLQPYHSDSVQVIKNRSYVEAAPGALTQADVLAKIGAILSARSDTFTIRSYGKAGNSITGKAKAEAYYEMVVQRTPAYVDATDADNAPATTAENLRFGRRFEVVSFRWLSGDEI